MIDDQLSILDWKPPPELMVEPETPPAPPPVVVPSPTPKKKKRKAKAEKPPDPPRKSRRELTIIHLETKIKVYQDLIWNTDRTLEIDRLNAMVKDCREQIERLKRMKYTPEKITSLEPNQIFVFGSNTEGIHGAGAAAAAVRFGAVMGQARGLQGQTYAIVTKDLSIGDRSIPVEAIHREINEFIDFATVRPELQFLVTAIGCGLAGYTVEEIASPFWTRFGDDLQRLPINIVLPESFYRGGSK